MGNIPNPFGSSSISDQTLNDAIAGLNISGDTQGASMLGGTSADAANIFGGGGGFNSFNDIVNAFSGGGGGAAPIANAQAPVPAGADPTGATGGTQSNTAPGQAPPQPGQGEGQAATPQQNQQQQQGGDVIAQLRDLLKNLSGQPKGPTGLVPKPPSPDGSIPLPFLQRGETGPQSPAQTSPNVLRNQLNARVPTDDGGRQIIVPVPGGRRQPFRPEDDPRAPAAPYRPEDDPRPQPPAAPAPAPAPAPGGPPVQYAGPQQAQPQQMSRLMRDIAGISHGNPTSLLDLVQALYPIIGGARIAASGGKPIGHDVNFAGPGEIQDFVNQGEAGRGTAQGLRDPLPGFDKNGQPRSGGAFARNGAFIGSPDRTPISNEIPGVTPKMVDSFVRQEAPKFGIDPETASKMVGAESSYGQNNLGDYVNGNPTSFGPLQLHIAPGAMGEQFLNDTGQRPQDFAQNWKQQIDYALGKAAKEGWTPGWTTSMNRLGLDKWSGIKRDFTASPTASSPLTVAPNLAG